MDVGFLNSLLSIICKNPEGHIVTNILGNAHPTTMFHTRIQKGESHNLLLSFQAFDVGEAPYPWKAEPWSPPPSIAGVLE